MSEELNYEDWIIEETKLAEIHLDFYRAEVWHLYMDCGFIVVRECCSDRFISGEVSSLEEARVHPDFRDDYRVKMFADLPSAFRHIAKKSTDSTLESIFNDERDENPIVKEHDYDDAEYTLAKIDKCKNRRRKMQLFYQKKGKFTLDQLIDDDFICEDEEEEDE